MNKLLDKFSKLEAINCAPERMDFRGNLALLDEPIISIVGSRAMSAYTKAAVSKISSALSAAGAVIASGGALGVDIACAKAAMPRTIAILPSGIDNFYPRSNAGVLEQIAQNGGLLLSEYERLHEPRKHDFLHRNRLVVACSQALIIAQADYKSGSLNSAYWAQQLNIPIYVIAQPLDASNGSMSLVDKGKAKMIFDSQSFIKNICAELAISPACARTGDEVLDFIGQSCSFEEAYARFGEMIYDYELDGLIKIDGMFIRPSC